LLNDEKKSLRNLTDYLYRFYGKKVAIIIDEFDSVLTYASLHKYYEKALGFIQPFLLSALKDNKNLRLGYLTGILCLA
jgi:hypothetical protein